MDPHRTDDLIDKRVLSGLGEEIGVVVDVDRTSDGHPKRLWIREHAHDPTSPTHRVKCAFIRTVAPDHITLKGPREGFHITRLGIDPTPHDTPQNLHPERPTPVNSRTVPMDTYGTRELPR